MNKLKGSALVKVLNILLPSFLIVVLARIAIWIYQRISIQMLADGRLMDKTLLTKSDFFSTYSGYAFIILYLVSLVVFLIWFRQAYYNIELISEFKTEYRKSWPIVSFFIPIQNLYLPERIMNEIIQKSNINNTDDIPDNRKSVLSIFWWILFISQAISRLLTAYTIKKPLTSLDIIYKHLDTQILNMIIVIPSIILFIIIINYVSSLQNNKSIKTKITST